MRRREFIAMLGGAAATIAASLAARAQPVPVVGILSSRSAATDTDLLEVLRQGLRDVGYSEGRNVAFQYRGADGRYDRLPAVAHELVRERVSVIVTIGGDFAALAAKAATTSIPIVFTIGGDPVGAGLVPNMNRPGSNLTGVTSMLRNLAQKRLGLLHELLPRAATIAVLMNPDNPSSAEQAESVGNAARGIGRETKLLRAATEAQVDAAMASLPRLQADALLVMADAFLLTRAQQITALAARYSLPAFYPRKEFAAAGGLVSYGSDPAETYRIMGIYVGRILKGEKPGDLPVQAPTKFELVINLKTAKALGIEVPPTLLARADEVIE